jgi:Zn finger protein HypA/HybF involved in hydrogenase expression
VSERDELTEHAEILRCEECGAVSADGRGWQAHLIVGPEQAEDEEAVAVLCPACVAREFDL